MRGSVHWQLPLNCEETLSLVLCGSMSRHKVLDPVTFKFPINFFVVVEFYTFSVRIHCNYYSNLLLLYMEVLLSTPQSMHVRYLVLGLINLIEL